MTQRLAWSSYLSIASIGFAALILFSSHCLINASFCSSYNRFFSCCAYFYLIFLSRFLSAVSLRLSQCSCRALLIANSFFESALSKPVFLRNDFSAFCRVWSSILMSWSNYYCCLRSICYLEPFSAIGSSPPSSSRISIKSYSRYLFRYDFFLPFFLSFLSSRSISATVGLDLISFPFFTWAP